MNVCAKLSQLCLTLCDPVECSPPGSSVPGILQTTILECVAFSSPNVSSRPRDWTCISYAYLHWPAGSVFVLIFHIKGHTVFFFLSLIHFTLHSALKHASMLLQINFLPFLWWILYVCVCIHIYHIFLSVHSSVDT